MQVRLARKAKRRQFDSTALTAPASAAALDSQKSERCYWGIGEAASRKIRTVSTRSRDS